MKGKVHAVCVSSVKGNKKKNIAAACLKENFGIVDDAHAGSRRQISLLAQESIDNMKAKGLRLSYGDFGENIVVSGMDLKNLPVSAKLSLGDDVVLEITEIGKTCLNPCAIYDQVGDCIMPTEGVFAKVNKGGLVKVDDDVALIK